MYRNLLVAVVALFVVSPAYPQTQSAVEREIVKLKNDLVTAVQKRDGDSLRKFLADEFIESSSSGAINTKPQVIAELTSDGSVFESYLLSELRVRLYGDSAVMTGLETIKSSLSGKDTSGAYRFTDVFVKREGRWQLVVAQSTRVPKK